MPKVAARFHRSRKRFVNHPVVREMMEAVHDNEIKPTFIRDFDRVVANWNNKPGFAGRKHIDADGFRVYVFPTGSEQVKRIWTFNVEGTRPHPIFPRNAPMLVFERGSYLPKTGPGGKWYGGPGKVVGGQTVRSFGVMHPGTEAREWPKVIAEKRKSYYSRTVENAWKRALRRMNS